MEQKRRRSRVGLFDILLAQFLTAPLWGLLSDKIGRKPVILISFLGSTAAYLWLAFADTLLTIYLARIFAGVMNGWLATSQAYVADVTDEEGRAKGMGMLGAAFGLGFIFGPALGGYLAGEADVNYQLPMIIAAVGSAAAFAISAVMLREPERHQTSGRSTLTFLPKLCAIPSLVIMIALYFALFFVFLAWNRPWHCGATRCLAWDRSKSAITSPSPGSVGSSFKAGWSANLR